MHIRVLYFLYYDGDSANPFQSEIQVYKDRQNDGSQTHSDNSIVRFEGTEIYAFGAKYSNSNGTVDNSLSFLGRFYAIIVSTYLITN